MKKKILRVFWAFLKHFKHKALTNISIAVEGLPPPPTKYSTAP